MGPHVDDVELQESARQQVPRKRNRSAPQEAQGKAHPAPCFIETAEGRTLQRTVTDEPVITATDARVIIATTHCTIGLAAALFPQSRDLPHIRVAHKVLRDFLRRWRAPEEEDGGQARGWHVVIAGNWSGRRG